MNDQPGNIEFDNLDPLLDSAIQAVLSEPIPNDAVEQVKSRASRLSTPMVTTWSHVRRTSLFRYGGMAAAMLVIAVLAFSSFLVDGTAAQAFAEVIQNIRQADSVQLRMTTRFGDQPEIEGKMYLVGDRLRMEVGGGMVHVGDLSQKRALYLDPHRKLAQSMAIDDQIAKGFANPIDQLRHAKTENAESIGEEYLNGRLTKVYRIRKVDLLGMRGKGKMLVWVDPKEGLPVKIVILDVDPKAETEIRFEDLVWNEPLNPNLFSLDIPDGYKVGTIVPTPRPANSSTTQPPGRIDLSQLAKGILSVDRVPGRLVWGPQGTTITAIMRDPESVAPHSRRSEELRQWNVVTGQLNWSVAISGLFSLALSDDGKTLVTFEGYELQLRDPNTGQVNVRWSVGRQLSPLAVSPDGKTLAAGIAEWGQPGERDNTGGVQLWDLEHRTLKQSMSGDRPTTFVRYSSDGEYVASAPNGGPVRIWNTTSGELVRIFPCGGKFDFSPNGKLLACMASQPVKGDTPADVRKRYDLQVYELQSGKLVKTLVSDDHTEDSYVLWVEFTPDSRFVTAANWDGTVKLWDVATGRLVKTITKHDAGVHTAVFAPDGNMLATGSEDKTLHLWNVDELTSP